MQAELIDLWHVDLDAPSGDMESLSHDERQRAGGFAFERHRRRFKTGRAALRTILGGYLGIDPRDVTFGYGEQGKPYLAGLAGAVPFFNLSHCEGLATIAVSRCSAVGVDIERLGCPQADVAAHAFAATENQDLMKVPEAQRGQAFYACWTRKEAFLKAVGLGFAYPSSEFAITLDDPDEGRVSYCRADLGPPEGWRLLTFVPARGFVGAVAAQAPARLRTRTR